MRKKVEFLADLYGNIWNTAAGAAAVTGKLTRRVLSTESGPVVWLPSYKSAMYGDSLLGEGVLVG